MMNTILIWFYQFNELIDYIMKMLSFIKDLLIFKSQKIWSYCLSIMNCVTKNLKNTVLIESFYINHL